MRKTSVSTGSLISEETPIDDRGVMAGTVERQKSALKPYFTWYEKLSSVG